MADAETKTPLTRKPDWLKRRLPAGEAFNQGRALIEAGRLLTVCQEAKCPNIWECYSHHTATFLIMGERCTRNCRFCSVTPGLPAPLDPQEPAPVAEAAARMEISYVVVTSVTRIARQLKHVEEKQLVLKRLHQERRLLARLREKKYAEFRREVAKVWEKETEALVLSRWGRLSEGRDIPSISEEVAGGGV